MNEMVSLEQTVKVIERTARQDYKASGSAKVVPKVDLLSRN